MDYRICPNCGRQLNAEAKFCGGCGTKMPPVEETRSCPHCGMPVRAGGKFCGYCGGSLEVIAEKTNEELTCQNCGEPLKEGAKFCGNCGTDVISALVVSIEEDIISDEADRADGLALELQIRIKVLEDYKSQIDAEIHRLEEQLADVNK